jgi:hypothetical protein
VKSFAEHLVVSAVAPIHALTAALLPTTVTDRGTLCIDVQPDTAHLYLSRRRVVHINFADHFVV